MAQKIVVAVDCDDVLVHTVAPVIKYYNKPHGAAVTPEVYYDMVTAFKVWATDDKAVRNDRVNAFFDTPEHMLLEPAADAVAVLRRLQQHCELHIITGRPAYTENQTLAWLEKYVPGIFKSMTFTGLFGEKPRSKADVCAELGVQFLVDDHPAHCQAVAAIGVQALLFGEYAWNQNVPSYPNIRRVANWREVEAIINAAR